MPFLPPTLGKNDLLTLLHFQTELGVDTVMHASESDKAEQKTKAIATTPVATKKTEKQEPTAAPKKRVERTHSKDIPPKQNTTHILPQPSHASTESLDDFSHSIRACTTLDQIRQILSQHGLTILQKTSENLVFSTDIPSPCPLLVVGDIPREEEDQSGIPFQNSDAKAFANMLQYLDFTSSNTAFCHHIFWRPPGELSCNPKDIHLCSIVLHAMISIIRPSWVITLGTQATQSITASSKAIPSSAFGAPIDTPTAQPLLFQFPIFSAEKSGNHLQRKIWLRLLHMKQLQLKQLQLAQS